jgi:hypothetical protein
MKKSFFLLIALFFVVSCSGPKLNLQHTPLSINSIIQGKIIIGDIKNLREKARGSNSFENLGVLRVGSTGIPVPQFTTQGRGLDLIIKSLLNDALLHSGYHVQMMAENTKIPVLETDIIDYWVDGFVGFAVMSKLRLRLLSSEKRSILLEKDFTEQTAFSIGDPLASYEEEYNKHLDEILKKIVEFFKSEEFNKSYKLSLT